MEGLRKPIAWERRDEVGLFRAFLDTTVEACGQPGRFFRTHTTEGGMAAPLSYALTVTTVGNLPNLALAALVALVVAPDQPGIAAIVSIAVCCLPVVALIDIGVGGAVVHAALRVLGQARRSQTSTMRAFAYAKAPFFFQIIPCYGQVLLPWVPIVEIAAVREAHRIDTLPAAVAVLGYRLLWVAVVVVIAMLAGG